MNIINTANTLLLGSKQNLARKSFGGFYKKKRKMIFLWLSISSKMEVDAENLINQQMKFGITCGKLKTIRNSDIIRYEQGIYTTRRTMGQRQCRRLLR